MSENCFAYGVMLALKEPLSKEAVEQWDVDTPSNFSVNYEGTLIYTELRRCEIEDAFGLTLFPTLEADIGDALDQAKLEGLDIDTSLSGIPYIDMYYNGTDSTRATFLRSDFMRHFEGTGA